MNKCINCEIKNLKTIIFHEFEFQKCYKCSYVRIFKKDFENFILLILNEYNIGNIKKYDSDFDCNEFEYKMIKDFENVFNNFQLIEETRHVCDICLENLQHNMFYNKFNFYYCNNCKSLYFLQNEFNEFLNFLTNDLHKNNYFLYLKVILKNNIRKIYFKIKEIFLYRRKKNNVKK